MNKPAILTLNHELRKLQRELERAIDNLKSASQEVSDQSKLIGEKQYEIQQINLAIEALGG